MNENKRIRNKQMIIRLTDKELLQFEEKQKKAKIKSRADFIMALVRDKPIIVFDELKDILAELKREGNNFNQGLRQMKSVNSASPPYKMRSAEYDLGLLYDKLSSVISQIAEVMK